MKGNRMNRQATRRISIPVAVCLSLLASCVSKPVEQDLASGDATVEIKYLDSVTMDIIDDTRTRRRKFYEIALNDPDKKYSQGKQGAIDRESTFAAAINANAQRDKSVLERYSAEGSRQLSALENSEELGEALLDHHKESMKQLDALNAERVKGAASQAEALQKKNEYAGLMFEQYLSALKEVDESIGKEIEKDEKRTLLNAEIGRKTTELNNAATSTEDKKRLTKEIEIATTEKNALGDSKTTELRGVRENLLSTANDAGFTLPDNKDLLLRNDGTKGVAVDKTDVIPGEFLEKTVTESGGKTITTEKVDITQHPDVKPPTLTNYLTETADKLATLKIRMDALASSDSKKALDMGVKLNSPPIERIRNDEAVFDYLLDGYRNTQIYSGAEYGGMVRRVLPFNFTFTPGSSTNSGFSARVVLRPDQQQIDEAGKMIAPHLNAVNRDRVIGYMQKCEEARRSAFQNSSLTEILLNSRNSVCSSDAEAIQQLNSFYEKFENTFYVNTETKQLRNIQFSPPSQQEFWRAYSVSVEALMNALEKKEGSHQYKYHLADEMISSINNILGKISKKKLLEGITTESLQPIVGLNEINYSSSDYMTMNNSCQLYNTIIKKASENVYPGNADTVKEMTGMIDNILMSMTSAGIVYNKYLQSNPLFSETGKNVINVVKNGSFYEASVPSVSYEENIKNFVAQFAVPRIVQNTSREHVVEIPDTAKINTLLSAGVTGNEVTQQLGLTLGAEIAAAVSSSSAFIKRIPYAVPFTGQSLCDGCERKDDKNQSFGWKYYKTPSGVTQFGGVAQSFKTIPLNSAVVVSMPEWMSKLKADYEISEDAGRTWKHVGEENIVLSGASLRGIFAETEAKPFDTWVKYNIYREVDDAVGLPKLKSCYGAKDKNIIYGNSGGDTAICGENLHGVKGVLVAGRYIDEGIEKVSSSLIKVRSLHLKPNDCPVKESCDSGDKCQVVLLSDFGASKSENPYCLQFSYYPDEKKQVDIAKVGGLRTEVIDSDSKIKLTLDATDATLMSHNLNNGADKPVAAGLTSIDLTKDELQKVCSKNKRGVCTIQVYATINLGGKNHSGPWYLIDMDALGWWKPFPQKAPRIVAEDTRDEKIVIEDIEENIYFPFTNNKINLRIGKETIGKTIITGIETSIPYGEITDIGKERVATACNGQESKCKVWIQYENDPDKEWIELLGTMDAREFPKEEER